MGTRLAQSPQKRTPESGWSPLPGACFWSVAGINCCREPLQGRGRQAVCGRGLESRPLIPAGDPTRDPTSLLAAFAQWKWQAR